MRAAKKFMNVQSVDHDDDDTIVRLEIEPLSLGTADPPEGFGCIPPFVSNGDVQEINAFFSCGPASPWRPDRATCVMHCRAAAGLWGTQMMWVGAFDVLCEQKISYVWGETRKAWGLAPDKLSAHIVYLVVGLLGLIAVDSLYANSGLDTKLNPRQGLVPNFMRWWNHKRHVRGQHIARLTLHALIAFWAMMLVWVAWYRIFDEWGPPSVRRDMTYHGVGFAALFLSQTVYQMALVFPPETEVRRRPHSVADSLAGRYSRRGCVEFVRECVPGEGVPFVRALVSLSAQNLLWVGSYNIQYHHAVAGYSMSQLLARTLLLIALGYLGMLLTGSVWFNAFVDFDAIPASSPRTVRTGFMSGLFYVRVAISLYAQLTFINGAWTLCDAFFFHNVWYRNLLLLLCGALLCTLAGTLQTNANVVPADFLELAEFNDASEVSAAHGELLPTPDVTDTSTGQVEGRS